jgi:hypothetical protein
MKSNLKYFFIIGVVILSCSQLVNKNKNSSSTTELAVNIPNHFEMTDEKLFEYAIKNKMGSCFIQDATKGTGFCQYYVKLRQSLGVVKDGQSIQIPMTVQDV